MAVIFTRTLDTNVTGWLGFSLRTMANSLTAGGDQASVRFVAATAGNSMIVDHCSIGILGTETFPNMAATDRAGRTQPIELLFSGVSGFNAGIGTTINSDFANISYYSSDSLVVVIDFSTTAATDTRVQNPGSPVSQFKASTTSYNTATVTGFGAGTAFSGLNQIENVLYQPGLDDLNLLLPSVYGRSKISGY